MAVLLIVGSVGVVFGSVGDADEDVRVDVLTSFAGGR